MKLSSIAGVALAGFAGLVVAQALKGPVNDAPFTEKWWPSKWGADDKAGSANHTKNSNNIKRALATVKQYKSITIGKYYHREASASERSPVFGYSRAYWYVVMPIAGAIMVAYSVARLVAAVRRQELALR